MQFAHTWEKVLSGEKRMTRRIVKPGEGLHYDNDAPYNEVMAFDGNQTGFHRVKYAVGKTYAVQPGRGKKAVGRIQIISIRREDVRYINRTDAEYEGFQSTFDFLCTWTKMHDTKAWKACYETDFSDGDESGITSHRQGWKSWLRGTRPAKYYDAWVLTFEVVK